MSEEIKAVTETAKATQEIAKVGAKAIDSSEKFSGFISPYISDILDDGLGIFGDTLKYWRWEKQERFMLRADEFLKKAGLDYPTKPLSFKHAIPLIEGASLEEDSDLQDLWAKLLVNASNADSGIDMKRLYVDILERISPLEAQILSAIYLLPIKLPISKDENSLIYTGHLPMEARLRSTMGKKPLRSPKIKDDIVLSLSNLAVLGCVNLPQFMDGGDWYEDVVPTVIGKNFVDACTLKITRT